LILDPHYTGKDEVATVLVGLRQASPCSSWLILTAAHFGMQGKGWCGWKEEAFWNARATYNLLLPGKPTLF
jgi:hypothetical protein